MDCAREGEYSFNLSNYAKDLLISSNGFANILPFTILCTVPLSFSKTKISFGPKNAILVGDVRPSKTTSAFKLESLIIGPSLRGRARAVLATLFKFKNDNTSNNIIINELNSLVINLIVYNVK